MTDSDIEEIKELLVEIRDLLRENINRYIYGDFINPLNPYDVHKIYFGYDSKGETYADKDTSENKIEKHGD